MAAQEKVVGDAKVVLPTATGARLGGDIQKTRFVLDVSQKVGFSVYVLENPYRVIIDLPEINFQLPGGIGQKGHGLVSAYRFGLFSVGRSRIVMDVKEPVLITKSFSIKAENGKPARLVLDIVKTDLATFKKANKKKPGEKIAIGGQATKQKSTPAPPEAKPKSAKSKKPVIVIDPGHGGVDPGAIGQRGTSEKNVVLAFSKVLAQKLKKTGRFRVRLTRNRDKFIRLKDRVKYARSQGADLFIAIHADSVPAKYARKARGATIYTLSERASDKEAAALAAQENRADIIAGVDLGVENDVVKGILIDLAQRETKNLSVKFARKLVKDMKSVTRMHGRPLRSAGFRVLKAPDVPSVLIELGYMSNRADEKLLLNRSWRHKTATSVTKAVKTYFATTRLAGGG